MRFTRICNLIYFFFKVIFAEVVRSRPVVSTSSTNNTVRMLPQELINSFEVWYNNQFPKLGVNHLTAASDRSHPTTGSAPLPSQQQTAASDRSHPTTSCAPYPPTATVLQQTPAGRHHQRHRLLT
ncbi:uncharacterized protein LOC120355767 isoform X2 [Nilaparvata lugens]|uniref:uncharacterized protein LOC120355767 isoform X2 n=1 Tax=Nilaparvata lugens TaxID=108931 RepID=UPI00193C9919|nr:uncharacterized protein LOC120355767 isoform X2 [Nilaparvata lugens]